MASGNQRAWREGLRPNDATRPPPDFILRGVHVLDQAGEFGGPTDVRVVDGHIAGLAANLPVEKSLMDVDLSGRWLLPGIVDTHLHAVTHSFDGWEQLSTPYSYRIAETLAALRATLRAGVTLVRDAGGLDAGVRNAVAAGLAEAPELQVSVVPLSRTGGHGDGFLAGAGLELATDGMLPEYLGRPPHLADGVDEVRRVVRTILRSGADWIKIMATGGVMSAGAGADVGVDGGAGIGADVPAEFTDDEIGTAVTEARLRGRPVMAHALGGSAIATAVRAGVRSIEHGLWLAESDAAAMAAAGTFLVPTLGIYAHLADTAGSLPRPVAERAAAAGAVVGQAVRIAREAGVRIALGTDFAHRDMHGRNLAEIAQLVRAGLPLAEALLAATANGADLCGVGSVTGRLQVGYRFDAIVLDTDPSDAEIFAVPESVTGVFAGGRAVRPHPRWPC